MLSNGAVVTGGVVRLVAASIAGTLTMVNARFEEAFARALPPHYAVLRSSTSFPTLQEVVLFGPTPAPRLAADGRPASRP